MLMDVGYTKTIDFKYQLDRLIQKNIIIVYHITQEIDQIAWEVFEQFNEDRTCSFTDCVSKVIMDRLGIFEAFDFDKHFEQMRFSRKP